MCGSMDWFQPITGLSGDPEMGTIKRTKAFSWLAHRVQMYTCLCDCCQLCRVIFVVLVVL